MLTFSVVDKKTGRPAGPDEIILEDWARSLVYTDPAGFAITEDGDLVLMDECGNYVYCPADRFSLLLQIPMYQ